MSNIINKSNHPVEVKKIDVRIWKLRDEIEDAIARRISEEGHSDDNPVDIEDIKSFYVDILNGTADNSGEEEDSEETDSNLDSSGNPMDDDAMAMMAALGGGEEEANEEAESDESSEEASEEKPADEESPEEQNQDEEQQQNDESGESDNDENEDEDDEAAMLAAQMLADQGLAPEQANESAENEDTPEAKPTREPFERKPPSAEKIADGFVLLSDIQMDQVMVFSKDTFIHGQNVVIEFLVPKAFSQMIEIVNSVNISRKSKIISANKPDFRLQCLFLFKFPGERSTLRNFLQSIEPEIPDPPKKLKRPETDEDDDDFDDLGF